jgi:hypothetical protein
MNTFSNNQIAKLGYGKLSYSDIYNLCCLATDAGIKLPTKFTDAIHTLFFEDMQPWAEADFDASTLFEVLEWQDRMTGQWQ